MVHSDLVVSDGGHVLDDDAMVRVLGLALLLSDRDRLLARRVFEQRLVEQEVGLDHVVDDRRLGDLLGAEGLLGVEVAAVVVALYVPDGVGHQQAVKAQRLSDEHARDGCRKRC